MHRTLSILLLFFVSNSYAQEKITLVNSGELIKEGIEYHDDGKYDKAILKYKQVPENDTNYTLMIYELGLTYMAQENFTKSIELYEKGMKLESTYKASFIQQLGNAYSRNKQLDKALETYRYGLKEFPYYFRYYSEMGAASYLNGKPKEALIYLDSCLQINFFHGRAHYLMGQICERNNYFIPAILSYQMAAYLSSGDQVGLSSLVQIQKIANGEIEIDKDSINELFAKGENNFEDIDEIIRSQSELDEKYKVKPAVNLPFNALVKSLHLVNNRLSLSPEGTGWYYENLVPIYLDWWNKKDFPIILYKMAGSVDNDQARKMFTKNKSKINKHYGNFYNEQMDAKFTYKCRIAGNKNTYKHLFSYINDNLFALIPKDEEYDFNEGIMPKNGYYIYFFNNGVKKSEGKYEDANLDGVWQYYTEKGNIIRKADNIGKDEFKRTTYYSNGQPESTDHYKDGKFINDYISYYPNGVIKSSIPVVNGVIDGKVKFYHDNGQLSCIRQFEKGKIKDGEEINYHSNGVVESKVKYKNEKMEGEVIEYYADGKIKRKTKYKDGKANGNSKEYHRNGTLKGDYNYSDGQYDGSVKEYYDNGVLETEANYTKGENKGKSLYYDFDGKLYAEYVENKGKIKTAIYYDKQGNKIYEVDAQKNELNLQKYNQVGIMTEEGKVKKDFRVGKWKFYSQSGALNTIKEYDEKGNFNGKVESYLVGDILDEKYEMKDNKLNGYYIEYYCNGNKRREGNYVDGLKEGVWRQLYINKEIFQEEFYVKGEREGALKYYYPNGKIKGIEEYKDGLFYKLISYDVNGNFASEDTIGYPSGTLIINYANGKPRLNFRYLNGKKEGKQVSYWANGNYRNVEEYKNGEQINNEYNYLPNGKLNTKYKYTDGERDSVYTSFYENGKAENTEHFLYDESNGEETYYYENGKIELTGINKDNVREGWFSFYSSDGMLQYKLFYHLGIELAYSYLNKSGKLVDSIPFKNASGDYTCYFQNGNLSAKGVYVNGQRHGVYTKYYANGKKEFETTYNYGLRQGLYIMYYDNGKIKLEVNYENNNKNGLEKEYDVNGKLVKETTWDHNYMNGPEKYYTNGKLVKTINYFYDDTADK